MRHFIPKLEILPSPQQQLWPELKDVPADFVLYGGTAIALHLGHRQSVDFDFFSSKPFEVDALIGNVPWLAGGERIQSQPNTLTVAVDRGGSVKVSFFGGLKMGCVEMPLLAPDIGLRIAARLDLFATKLKTVQDRAESRDYIDIAALMRAGISLADGLAAATAVYGERFNPMISLKALSYFRDGDLPQLPAEVRELLATAAGNVREIPEMPRASDQIGG